MVKLYTITFNSEDLKEKVLSWANNKLNEYVMDYIIEEINPDLKVVDKN
jgi:hypothetical protein